MNFYIVNTNTKKSIQLYNLPIKFPNDVVIDYNTVTTKLQGNDYHKYPPDELLINFYLFLSINRIASDLKEGDVYYTIKNDSLIDSVKLNIEKIFKKYKRIVCFIHL